MGIDRNKRIRERLAKGAEATKRKEPHDNAEGAADSRLDKHAKRQV